METTKELAKRLFDENIYPHIIGDLKILDNIQPLTHSNTCAVPTAMLILRSLDFLGYLLRENGSLEESEINIQTSIRYKDYFSKTCYNQDIIKDLTVFYRHGMMHNFYPRQTSNKIYGLHKSEKNELFEIYKVDNQSIISLNVNVLSNDFKIFVDKLYEEVKITSDEIFLENITKGFKHIYPSDLTSSATTTTQTTIAFGVSAKK